MKTILELLAVALFFVVLNYTIFPDDGITTIAQIADAIHHAAHP